MFAPRYFAPRYFAPRYWTNGEAGVVIFDWFVPLSEPVRPPHQVQEGFFELTIEPTPFGGDSINWHQPWSLPLFDDPVTGHYFPFSEIDPTALTFPANVTIDMWYQPWDKPTLPLEQFTEYLIVNGALEPGLVKPPDSTGNDPPRAIGLNYQTVANPPWSVVDSLAPVEDLSWFVQFTDPPLPREPLTPVRYISNPVTLGDADFPANVTIDMWHQPWSEPTFVPDAAISEPVFHLLNPADIPEDPFPGETGELPWFVRWTDPPLPPDPTYWYPTFFVSPDALLQPENQFIRWYEPFSQPVFDKPVTGHYFPFTTIDPVILTQPENVTVDQFFKQMEVPVLPPPRLQGQERLSVVDPVILLQPENITIDKWYQPWSVPPLPLPRAVSLLLDPPQPALLEPTLFELPFPPRAIRPMLTGGMWRGGF